MKLLDSLRFRIATFFQRSQINAEMEEELRSHIQHRADDLERSGLARAEAERRARIEFGGQERFKRGSPGRIRRQFCRDSDTGYALQPARVAQVSRIHNHCRFDAGSGNWRERRGLWGIERDDPSAAECAPGGKPLRNRARKRI